MWKHATIALNSSKGLTLWVMSKCFLCPWKVHRWVWKFPQTEQGSNLRGQGRGSCLRGQPEAASKITYCPYLLELVYILYSIYACWQWEMRVFGELISRGLLPSGTLSPILRLNAHFLQQDLFHKSLYMPLCVLISAELCWFYRKLFSLQKLQVRNFDSHAKGHFYQYAYRLFPDKIHS